MWLGKKYRNHSSLVPVEDRSMWLSVSVGSDEITAAKLPSDQCHWLRNTSWTRPTDLKTHESSWTWLLLNNPDRADLCGSRRTPCCDWPRCAKCKRVLFCKNEINKKNNNIFLFVAFVDTWPSGYMLSSMTVSLPLWLHYPWLHVPVTCRDIKGDPILLVFVVSATCHANKDLAGRSWQDHKMAITGGFLRKSWPAGDCLPPSSLRS